MADAGVLDDVGEFDITDVFGIEGFGVFTPTFADMLGVAPGLGKDGRGLPVTN